MKPDAALRVAIVRLAHGEGLALPAYATAHSAGMDLRAAIPEGEPLTLAQGERCLVPTGIAIALPKGFEGQVRPRSGLALHLGITCLNTPGTIDADYRGEIGVIMINHGDSVATVSRGDRIAQLVIAPVIRAEWVVVDGLPDSDRGAQGFGSSGAG